MLIHELSLLLFCSVSPLYVYMGGFCCMRPLVGVTHVRTCLDSAGFRVPATRWPCFFCRLRSLCSFAAGTGGEGAGAGACVCVRIVCRWYCGRGGRDAVSYRGPGPVGCIVCPLWWWALGRGGRGTGAGHLLPFFIYIIERGGIQEGEEVQHKFGCYATTCVYLQLTTKHKL